MFEIEKGGPRGSPFLVLRGRFITVHGSHMKLLVVVCNPALVR
jgi:hypothetical protein